MKLILFDIDGTLLLTGGAGRIAFERTFHDIFGISNSWGQLIPDGKTDPMLIEEIALRILQRKPTSQEEELITETYCKYFEEELPRSNRFRLLPGVTTLLEQLVVQKNIVIGIATGNFEMTSWLKLKRANLNSYFSFGGFASDSRIRHELVRIAIERAEKQATHSFSPKDIFVVGDSIYDIRAARHLNVRPVAVVTGSTTQTQLEKESPEFILQNLESIHDFLSLVHS